MPLPTNYSRPAIPYNPVQVLPNYDRYSSLGQFPPTPQQLDGDFNRVIDLVNTLAGAINDTAAGIFPGADTLLNANRLPTTDGHGNVSWTLINPLNLDVNAVQTQHIQDTAITTPKIQVQAVGTNQLADGAVSYNKLADGAIGNAKLANNSTMLVKLRSTGHSCLVMGDDADYAYKELPMAPNYTIPTRIANATLPSMQPLSVVWNNNADNLCFGTKLKDASTLISKLRSSAKKCLVMGTEGSHFYTEKVADNQSQPWYVFCNNPNADSIALNSLVDIWQNTPFTFTGSKLTDNSVPVKKIDSYGKFTTFAMAYVYANGTAQKASNCTITRTGTGYYLVRFSTAAPHNKYIVVFGSEDMGDNVFCWPTMKWNSRTVNGFDIFIRNLRMQAKDYEFNFAVYAF